MYLHYRHIPPLMLQLQTNRAIKYNQGHIDSKRRFGFRHFGQCVLSSLPETVRMKLQQQKQMQWNWTGPSQQWAASVMWTDMSAAAVASLLVLVQQTLTHICFTECLNHGGWDGRDNWSQGHNAHTHTPVNTHPEDNSWKNSCNFLSSDSPWLALLSSSLFFALLTRPSSHSPLSAHFCFSFSTSAVSLIQFNLFLNISDLNAPSSLAVK